jgi:acyl carrier protein
MTDDQAITMIRQIFSKCAAVPPDQVKLESSLVDDLGFDSLAMFEVLMEAETAFDIKVDGSDLPSLQTVAELLAYVKRLQGHG